MKREKLHAKEAHEDAAAYAREIATEGIVLLKNEGNLLPLAKGIHLNLFGLRCVEMNYNGGGSAASDESKCITLEKALRQAGFLLNQDLLNLNYNYLKNGKYSVASLGENYKVKSRNKQKGGAEFVPKPGSPVKSEIPVEAFQNVGVYPNGQSVMDYAKQFWDTVLVVLARGSGEGYDLDPKDLRLTESEKRLLKLVCGQFSRVILILNTANVMEMGWLTDYPSIKRKWMVEKGEYRLSVRSDAHYILDETIWMLAEDVVFEGTSALFADADTDSLTRSFPEWHRAFTGPTEEDYQADNAILQALDFHVPTDEKLGLSMQDMPPPTAHYAGLKLKDMAGIEKEDSRWDTFVQQLTVGKLCHLCGNGAWQTAAIPRLGVPRTVIPDGSTSMASTVFSTLVMGKKKAGMMVAGVVSGVQSHRVNVFLKHFAMNERETNARNSSLHGVVNRQCVKFI